MSNKATIIGIVVIAIVLQLAVLIYAKHESNEIQKVQSAVIEEPEVKNSVVQNSIVDATKSKDPPPQELNTENSLRFGIIMNQQSKNVPEQIEPLLKDLEQAIGMPVQLVVTEAAQANNFSTVQEGLENNTVDVGILAPNALAQSVSDGYVDAFASIYNYNGSAEYSSVLFVHKDSDIKSIRDIVDNKKKHTFSYTTGVSNFGQRLPTFFFAYHGIDPVEHFSKVIRLDRFAEILDAVLDRSIDVGVSHTMFICRGMANSDASKRAKNCSLRGNYPGVAENLRIIWESPAIRINSLGYRRGLDADLKAKISQFFYNYGGTEREKKILTNIDFYQMGGFRKITNDDPNYVWLIKEYTRGKAITDENRQEVIDTIGPLQKTERFYKIDANGNSVPDEVGLSGWSP